MGSKISRGCAAVDQSGRVGPAPEKSTSSDMGRFTAVHPAGLSKGRAAADGQPHAVLARQSNEGCAKQRRELHVHHGDTTRGLLLERRYDDLPVDHYGY